MERIQSALAKARTLRESKAPAADKSGVRRSPPGAAWEALPELRLDPEVLEQNRIVSFRPSQAAISFDVMRTNLLRQLRANGWTRVAITSPTAGCGKTTVALNLAFSLARLAQIKVLVIELDLRRPTMARTLGAKVPSDFTRVLKGAGNSEDGPLRWGTSVAFCLSSAPVTNTAELLSAATTADAIDDLEARLGPDVILFDTPPMLVNDDTIAFLDQVDCALMVAAAEETKSADVDRCGIELAKHTKVMGVILNKCRFFEHQEDYASLD